MQGRTMQQGEVFGRYIHFDNLAQNLFFFFFDLHALFVYIEMVNLGNTLLYYGILCMCCTKKPFPILLLVLLQIAKILFLFTRILHIFLHLREICKTFSTMMLPISLECKKDFQEITKKKKKIISSNWTRILNKKL